MDFELPESHRILRGTVREFCEREVAPYARSWDAEECFPSELVPKLANLGILGIGIPEAYGGAGMDTLAYAICVEECARFDGALALTIASHNGLGVGPQTCGLHARSGFRHGLGIDARRRAERDSSPCATCLAGAHRPDGSGRVETV